MLRFLVDFVIYFAITAASSFVVAWVATRGRRRHRQRKWLKWAAVISAAAAAMGWSSRSLRDDCLSERNEGCIDAGGAGWQLILIVGYVLFALGSAYFLYHN